MKFTKRFAAILLCATMTASTLVDFSAFAVENNFINGSIDTNENVNITTPNAIRSSHSISGLGTEFGQDDTSICWAACIQEVLSYYNISKTQTEIVQARDENGEYHNSGANYSVIASVLNHFGNSYGYSFLGDNSRMAKCSKVMAKINADKPVIMAGTLTNGNGSSAHALLCYGYDKSNSNNIKLYVISPNMSGGRKITLVCNSENATSFTSEDDSNETYSMVAYISQN